MLAQQVRLLARAQVCARAADELASSADLAAAAAAIGGAPLNYDAYCTLREAVSPKIARYLTASLFARLPRGGGGDVAPRALLAYVREAEVLRAVYARLALFDGAGDGWLREAEVENYVYAAMPAVPDLAALQESFAAFYVFTAVRALFFHLDPHRTGRVALRALAGSRVFAEWLAVLPAGHPDLGPAGAPPPPGDDAVPPRAPPRAANWFLPASALRVYASYLALDADQNGMLSVDELAGYGGGAYTRAFAARVFEEAHTYAAAGGGAPEIDYKAFLDVVLATENRGSPPALRFFFRLLDVRHQGWFGLPEIRAFYALVAERLVELGHEAVDAGNVADEILDMAAPAAPGRVTLQDLRACKVGGTVVGLLFDAAAFVAYDTREEAAQAGARDADADEP